MQDTAADRFTALSADERWLVDAGKVANAPGGVVLRTVDMTAAIACLDRLTRSGLPATPAHLVVRAAALVLTRNPELHATVCGYRTSTPGAVDVGLTADDLPGWRPVVLRGADQHPLPALVRALNDAITAAPREERAAGHLMRLVPFGLLRRFVLRWLQRRFWFVRRLDGTFHVTYVPGADVFVPLRFYTGSALGVGRVHEIATARRGRIEVRRVVSLALVVDHVALDGMRAATLLKEIADILEGGELGREALSVN
ncbi:MAG: 2-oxo acid dehydrogenase subunit E2 [Polyangiaceae bacterium]